MLHSIVDFQVILLSILVADLLVYVLYLSPLAFYYLPFRLAPYIRVILCILNIRYVDIYIYIYIFVKLLMHF